MNSNLSDRWSNLWTRAGLVPSAGLVEELIAAYGQPLRAYHNLQHLVECLEILESVRGEAEKPFELELAIWFHDAVYDPKAKDNESQSADWAMRALPLEDSQLLKIRDLILDTRHVSSPNTDDGSLIVDIDLAILGADRERFDEYERQIREEYSWVSDDDYRTGRTKILRTFLDRSPLYRSPSIRHRLESRARDNLQRSISALGQHV